MPCVPFEELLRGINPDSAVRVAAAARAVRVAKRKAWMPAELAAVIREIRTGKVDKPERELLTDPHRSIERMRSSFLEAARGVNNQINATLLDLWPHDRPLTQELDDKLAAWAQQQHLETEPIEGLEEQIAKYTGTPAPIGALADFVDSEPKRDRLWVIDRARKVLERRYELNVEAHFDKAWITAEAFTWLTEAWGFDPVLKKVFIPPEHAPWHPESTTAAAYDQSHREYMAATRDKAIKEGWVIAPFEKHERKHFLWLARYQVDNQSYAKIANSLPSGDGSKQRRRSNRALVEKEIKALAIAIGLKIRPA
jgi:hypothetical protein